jgi:YVTN family beta-propeller protein
VRDADHHPGGHFTFRRGREPLDRHDLRGQHRNTIYVANASSDTVSVINGATNTVTTTVPVGSGPIGVGVNPSTNTIYVANSGSNNVSVVDGATNALTATIPVGTSPFGVGVNPSTDTIYVANIGSGSVSVIDGRQVPGVPTVTGATAGNGQVTLSWSASATGSATPLTSYVVAAAPQGGGTASVTSVPANQFQTTIGGLTNGTTYQVTVTANNAIGAGSPSVAKALAPAGPTTTATALSSSANPSVTGQAVTYTATVSPTPNGGTASFSDNGSAISTCTAQPVNTTTGQATCTLTYSSAGSHGIEAAYSGNATFSPSTSPPLVQTVNPPAPSEGYYEVASDGGIFAFGNAMFQGSMGGLHLNAPIVGMAVDSTTGGYYLVASDGGIFAFNAPFQGSMGGKPLNAPIVGMAFAPTTGGYYEAASDGGTFAFNAPFYGSMGGRALTAPMVGMAAT